MAKVGFVSVLGLAIALFSVFSLFNVSAVSVGTGNEVSIGVEQFKPLVWKCFEQVLLDDFTEPGRISNGSQFLRERTNNYAFEGEKVALTTLVMDKNGIDKVNDVYFTVGTDEQGGLIQANCQRFICRSPCNNDNFNNSNSSCTHQCSGIPSRIFPQCNARIGEENLTEFDALTMAYYNCIFTVETSQSMYGENWLSVEAVDLDGNTGDIDEKSYWFFNPVVAISVGDALSFSDVRPGTDSYSNTMTVGNAADSGSGVMMDMFISGTDFYDSSSSGGKCPETNQLSLTNLRYFAANGAYSTTDDFGNGRTGINGQPSAKDSEGYVGIGYGIGFNNPHKFYNGFEIIQAGTPKVLNAYYPANILAPDAEMSLTFKLSLPEPCNGNFDTGSIYFWGEAI